MGPIPGSRFDFGWFGGPWVNLEKKMAPRPVSVRFYGPITRAFGWLSGFVIFAKKFRLYNDTLGGVGSGG